MITKGTVEPWLGEAVVFSTATPPTLGQLSKKQLWATNLGGTLKL